jgi:hypothetical protein
MGEAGPQSAPESIVKSMVSGKKEKRPTNSFTHYFILLYALSVHKYVVCS